jgi:2-polyprenyl-6-hydroxyphenyl methylase/3-demethylubiquinone-9 3-methyltransferase
VNAVLEDYVSARFDALEPRFKRNLAHDDFRLAPLVERFCAGRPARLLDLGCGKGRFARALIERGATVVGADSSPAMLRRGNGFERLRARSRQLPFAPESFDGVFAVELLEHLPVGAIDPTLQEIRRVLRPGGALAIIDKNAAAIDSRRPWLPALVVKWIDEMRGRWMYPWRAPFRERWFWPWALQSRLARAFEATELRFLVSPEEAGHRLFERLPMARRFALWSARKPGGAIG